MSIPTRLTYRGKCHRWICASNKTFHLHTINFLPAVTTAAFQHNATNFQLPFQPGQKMLMWCFQNKAVVKIARKLVCKLTVSRGSRYLKSVRPLAKVNTLRVSALPVRIMEHKQLTSLAVWQVDMGKEIPFSAPKHKPWALLPPAYRFQLGLSLMRRRALCSREHSCAQGQSCLHLCRTAAVCVSIASPGISRCASLPSHSKHLLWQESPSFHSEQL